MQEQTVCFVERSDGSILLGEKKRTFGVGFLNGYGGSVNPGESIEDAAVRETKEEALIDVWNLKYRGKVCFYLPNGKELLVYFYSTKDFSGVPIETDEMRPAWFSELPVERMFPGDRCWVPFYIAGQIFEGWVRYGEKFAVLEHKITPVAE